ncbi:MAG: extracellular solute-binding protein, partial [Aquificota bacterium]
MKKLLTGVLTTGVLISSAIAGETINGAGSTFAYPLFSAWAYQYYKETGTKLNYQSIGSGGGVRQIANRTVDFGASDDALPLDKLNKLKLYQWPQMIGGEVLAINIPGIKSEQMVLDADTVCHIYTGDIKYWDNPKLKALNPNLKLPHKKIKVVHRSDGSGTTA